IGRVSRYFTTRACHHDRSIGDDPAKQVVQGGNRRPGLTRRPDRQITERTAGYDREVQRVSSRSGRNVATGGIQDGEVAWLAGRQRRRSQTCGKTGFARIGDATRSEEHTSEL